MKLLSSSPSISSSSSSSTVPFDPTICTPKSATAGCLAGILRRILCFQSLPTHPSDHITESGSIASYKKQQFNAVDKSDGASKVNPGIVARLMGLDTMPEISLLDTQVNPNSITRSRSMSSADYKQDTDSIHGKYRRASSFRDMPYFEIENEEFFVISFEKGSERKQLRSKGRKCKGGSEVLKENRVEKTPETKNKEDHEHEANKRVLSVVNEEKLNRRIVDKPMQEIDKKAVPDGAKLRKKKRHSVAQIVEPECSSEDSSPVSVLDFGQFIIDHGVPTSEEDFKADKGCNSRRKLSPELENCGCKSPSNDGNLMEDDQRVDIIEGKYCLESRKKDCHSEKNLECWDEICRMIEVEVAKSSWLWSKNEDHLEDITADFGSEILDQLLDELVVQLFG
ncbi:hypothetical protein PTKIN_Ptkin11bG0047100 [Pterospermum kingtungense]